MRRLAAPFLLLLLCIGFYWRLTLTSEYTFLDSPDLANLDLPRLQFQAAAWRQSFYPLWDPYHWAGQPFLGQVTGAAYPVNWLLWLFPSGTDGKLSLTGIHWYLVLLHFQAALFCYLLCRDWKRSRTASILGGLVFSLGGFAGTTSWPQILNGTLWLPLILLFLLRALRGRRPLFSAAMSGALLGLAWLSGHHEVPIYASTAVAAIWLTALFAAGPRRVEIGKLALAAALACGLIAALQIVPALEYAPLAKRWVNTDDPVGGGERIPYSVHRHYSWSPAAVLGIVTPRPPVHIDPFIGIAAFSLALLGLYHGWRRLPQVRILTLLAIAGLLLAMASNNVVHGLLYAALPGFGKARVPARALALFGFAIAPLVAYGFDALQRRSSPWLRRTVFALAAIGGLLYAAAASGFQPAQPRDSAMFTALAAILTAALFAAWRARAVPRGLLAIALPLLVLIELGNVSGIDFTSRKSKLRPGYIERLFQHDDIASYLRQLPQPVRIEVADADIPYNFGEWHGIPMLGGFAASVTSNIYQLGKHRPRVQDLLGVNYHVARTPPRPELILLAAMSSGLNIYQNPSALPRAWAVHSATQAESVNFIGTRLDSPEFQPRQEALLLTPAPALESCAGGEEVSIANGPSPNRVDMDVTMGCRGMVILSDTHFPGWRARVDGRDTEILAPFGALRGVVVEKGRHRIEFIYLPLSAIAGAGCAAAGVLFVFWTLWRSRKPKSA